MTSLVLSNIEKKTLLVVPEGQSLDLPLTNEPGTRLIEIIQKPGSKLNLSYIADKAEEKSGTFIRLILERGARAECFTAVLEGASTTYVQEAFLEGEDASFQQKTVFLGSNTQDFDMHSNTILKAPRTSAFIEAKGILLDHAKARFDGEINIEQEAKDTDAKLIEHTLLLSPNARMNAIPALNIGTNHVRASHSASVTKVDDEQLFYAESRGIDEHTAIQLIAEGFLAKIFENHPQKEHLDSLIKKKLCTL